MNIFDHFSAKTCNPFGKNNGLESWSKSEYLNKKKELGEKVVLVSMIEEALPDSVKISNEMFNSGIYPEGTIFILYCHSGGSSGYLQKQLAPQFPQYSFVNLTGGVMAWNFN